MVAVKIEISSAVLIAWKIPGACLHKLKTCYLNFQIKITGLMINGSERLAVGYGPV